MKQNQTLILVVLGVVLIGVLWFLFLFKPASDELAEVNVEITSTQDRQTQLQAEVNALQEVRQEVTSIEATLAAYQGLVTPDPGLPSLLRQLQMAANDSGMDLRRVAPGEPTTIEEIEDVLSISLVVELEGGYFQLVDFLRRVEDPVIVGRVMLVDALTVGLDEYPTLTVGITARVFTTAETGADAEAPTTPPEPSPGDTESPEATDPEMTPTEEVPS